MPRTLSRVAAIVILTTAAAVLDGQGAPPAPAPARAAPAVRGVAQEPSDVVRAARLAVEGDSVRAVTGRWEDRLRREPGDRLARLGLATIARLLYDARAAEQHYPLLYRDAARPDAVAREAMLGHGTWLMSSGRNAEADALLARAQAAARAAGDASVEAGALIARAVTRRALAGTQAGLAYADSAIRATPAADIAQMARNRCQRAFILGVLSARDAEPEALRGIALARQVGEQRAESLCLRTLAVQLENRTQYDSALTVMRRAAVLDRASRSFRTLGGTLARITVLEIAKGRFGDARRSATEMLAVTRAAHDTLNLTTAHQLLGVIGVQTGDYASASAELARAVSVAGAIGDEDGAMYARSYQVEVLAATGDLAGARRLAQEISPYFETRVGKVATAAHRRLVALLALRAGDLDAAQRELASTRAYAVRHGLDEWANGNVADFTRLALRRGDLHAADTLIARQLRHETASPDHGDPNVLAVYEARAMRAELHARRGELARAARELHAASEQLDRWRQGLDDAELRVLAFQSSASGASSVSGSVARVLAALASGGQASAAFELAERRRARTLADRLVQGLALGAASARSRPAGNRAPTPARGGGGGGGGAAPRTAIVEYVTGPEGAPTTVLVVTRDGVRGHVAPAADSLAGTIARLGAMIERGADARPLARSLGAALLDHVVAGLPAGVGRLVIVPDGVLHRVPFDALRMPDGRYVAERFAVSRAPSAALLADIRRRRAETTGSRLLAVGDPTFGGERAAADAEAFRSAFARNGGLARLVASGREARAVARYASQSDVWLREQASESAFKRAPLAAYQVVHLATHALVDDQSVARTAIALAPGGGEDGFLTPGELAGLRLRADLVVLSACRTAGGVVVAGEGVQGLTAPLLAAGARAVVATDWRIGDRSAMPLVESFYGALARGLPVGDALHAAKRDAIARGVPPREWAAFTVVGDPTVVLALREPATHTAWLVGGALLAAAGLAATYSTRRRKPESADRS